MKFIVSLIIIVLLIIILAVLVYKNSCECPEKKGPPQELTTPVGRCLYTCDMQHEQCYKICDPRDDICVRNCYQIKTDCYMDCLNYPKEHEQCKCEPL